MWSSADQPGFKVPHPPRSEHDRDWWGCGVHRAVPSFGRQIPQKKTVDRLNRAGNIHPGLVGIGIFYDANNVTTVLFSQK